VGFCTPKSPCSLVPTSFPAMSEMLKLMLKKFVIAAVAPSMRSPSGITGWFARRMMRSANPESTRFAIRNRLNLQTSDVFVELGAGEGAGIKAIMGQDSSGGSSKIPSTIHLVEISDAMRTELSRVVGEELPESHGSRIEIHADDCITMPYLADDSVDKMFAMNVVYFLDPLPDYLKEIRRVLKPGGEIVWGCKFDKVPKDSEVFVNVEEAKVVAMMEDAGFQVSSERIDVAGANEQECSAAEKEDDDDKPSSMDMRNYLELKGRKPEK